MASILKRHLLVPALALFLAGTCGLVSAEERPQLLLIAGGMYGVETAPPNLSGGRIQGGQGGLEWMPAGIVGQRWGLDLDYEYLAMDRSPATGADDNIDVSLRWLPATFGITSVTVQAGIGYNMTPNAVSGHYLAFVGPGVRVVLAPRAALDAGLKYRFTTPASDPVQDVEVTLGVSIPLDGPFTPSD